MAMGDITQLPVDFLAIGHICQDVAPGGYVIGGAAAYSAAVAAALGCRAGVVTSAAAGLDCAAELPNVLVKNHAADSTTIFENIYTAHGREQIIHAVAGGLTAAHVPPLWTRAPIVFLGPIANEVDPAIIELFSDSIIGAGPQGWMRRWDEDGRVASGDWDSAAGVLPLAAVTFLSTEDLPDPALVDDYARQANILVVTDGPRGCTVYYREQRRAFPAPQVRVVDSTGAGDTFAAAYLVRFHQTKGDLWEAAEFANRIAARSVTRHGLREKTAAIRELLGEELRRAAALRGEL